MNSAARSRPDSEKSELRRQQVLDAATECFRREGFHGSSIARISQAAGMSPGHIYHYFENKEAIVQAIAERDENDMAELLRAIERDAAKNDVITRMVDQTSEMIQHATAPEHASLMLELAAEAARNEDILKIIQRTDRTIAAQFAALMRRENATPHLDDHELGMRLEMIAALFNGMAMRACLNPNPDPAAMTRLANRIIRILLEPDA